MTKIAIMQPTFLPWIGYFSLIKKVDKFIFLDSVQFDKRSWQQRNKIRNNNKFMYVTIPVLSKNKFDQKISEVKIDRSSEYIEKHLKSLKLNYSSTNYFDIYFDDLKKIYENNFEYLSELNINLIKHFSNLLNVETEFFKSSDYNFEDNKTKLLINICKYFKANTYISPDGSKDYLIEKDFSENDICLEYQNYIHPKYNQNINDFIPHLSIVDLFFNEGAKSKNYI